MEKSVEVRSFRGIAETLGGACFEPVRYAERYRLLGDQLVFDVSEIVAAIQHVPLCLRGQDHFESRKRLAGLIATVAPKVREMIESDLPGMVETLLSEGRRDVMTDFVHPFVSKVIGAMIGLTLELQDNSMISRLFSQSIGISKRRRMNNELGALKEVIKTALPDATDTEIGDRVALCILGTDALRGTLGRSIHALFIDGFDGVIDREQADFPPRTGVPYIDRESITDVMVEGRAYPAGSHFRARLETLEADAHADTRQRYFGFGTHTCLGRKLSLEIWKAITAALQHNPASVQVLHYALRHDDVFYIPEKFEIEVSRVENP